jgi:osmotically inducible protein OsmC
MKRTATAAWSGGLQDGTGTMSTGSGAVAALPYGFKTRFTDEPGTNPEELIAAAHAGCFSMALSAQLGNAGLKADRIETKASLSFEKKDAGWTVTGIHLDVVASVPGADAAAFATAAEGAKAGCPISRLLAPGTTITMSARLG